MKHNRVSLIVICAALLLTQTRCSGPSGTEKDLVTVEDDNVGKTDAYLRGEEILKASRQAYSKLRSYQGTIRIASTSQYGERAFSETRYFTIAYQRPGRIRLEGKDSNGDAILIVSDGQRAYESSWGAQTGPEVSPVERLPDVLSANSGVSLRATNTLPGILLETQWSRQTFFLPRGELLSALASKARWEGTTDVDGHKCHRIVCEREIQTWTVYVDAQSHLVRLIEETASTDQQQAQRRLGGGGFSGRIESTKLTQNFDIQAIDTEVDPSRFKIP